MAKKTKKKTKPKRRNPKAPWGYRLDGKPCKKPGRKRKKR